MNLSKLMSKWWFRLCIFVGFAVIMAILTLILTVNYDSIIGSEHPSGYYMNNSAAPIIACLGAYPAVILMYFTCDIMNNLRFKITKLLRTLLLILSLVLYAVILLITCVSPLANGADKPIANAFYDGLAFAPLMTYPLVYFFVAGKFDETKNFKPNRIKEFILILGSLVAPVLLGFLLMLIIKLVGNSTVTFIVLIAFMVIIAGGFIISFKKYGLLVGGLKEYQRDYPSSPASSGSSSGSEAYIGSSSDGTQESIVEWRDRLRSAIETCGGANYIRVYCDASVHNDTIQLDVEINVSWIAENKPELLRGEYDTVVSQVERKWKKAAEKCPYRSNISFRAVQ